MFSDQKTYIQPENLIKRLGWHDTYIFTPKHNQNYVRLKISWGFVQWTSNIDNPLTWFANEQCPCEIVFPNDKSKHSHSKLIICVNALWMLSWDLRKDTVDLTQVNAIIVLIKVWINKKVWIIKKYMRFCVIHKRLMLLNALWPLFDK